MTLTLVFGTLLHTPLADLESVNPPEPDVTLVGDATPEPSLAEHEAQFNGGSIPDATGDEGEPEPPKAARGADGKFVKGERHRAAKAQAGAEDVPRIQELTRKLRDAERERDEWKGKASVPSSTQQPVAPIEREPQTAAQIERDWNKEVARYKNLPGFPQIDKFQDYGDAMLAQKLFIDDIRRNEDRAEARRESERTQLVSSWRNRTDEARTRHTDFEQVALQAPTKIPQGSLVDAWILESDEGAEVLYELQRDDLAGGHLLTDILSAPTAIKQAYLLSQLALRLSPSTRTQAASTGAAVPTARQAAPRPPTPVRTSAMQMADEPPDDETASLAEHEKYYVKPRRR